ncbi:MAG: GNAT family N-acetyltransferase [Bacteroidales bacterium]|nr:GNAT family N-acetyltransferase [Bacteroidales bacterium]
MAEAQIRAMEPSDVDLIFHWENDPQQWKDGSGNCRPMSKTDIQRFVDNSTLDIYQERQMRLMISDAEGIAVGCIDLFDFDPFSLHASIGVLVDEKYRQQGYAAFAVGWIVDYSFEVLGLKSLCATMLSTNIVSKHLFEKCGFEYVGKRRQWYRIGDTMYDELIYQYVNSPTK